MNTSNQVIVYFFRESQGEYIDPEMDVELTYPGGILTWRREGQIVSPAMQELFRFDVEEAHQDHSVVFAQRLMSFTEGYTTQGKAVGISMKFHQDIRAALAKGDSWGYFHSESHSSSVKFNENESQRGVLTDWEREILMSGTSGS